MWTKIVNEETLPVPPCIGYWCDGKQTVLDTQNDCEYAVHLIGGKSITHWMPLPEAPQDNVEGLTEQHTTAPSREMNNAGNTGTAA